MEYNHNIERGKGRTQAMVQLANDTGAYLVVRNHQMAEYCQKLGCKRFPVTYAELMGTQMRGSFVRNIVIDDADAFLAYIFPHLTIDGISTGSLAQPEPARGQDELE